MQFAETRRISTSAVVRTTGKDVAVAMGELERGVKIPRPTCAEFIWDKLWRIPPPPIVFTLLGRSNGICFRACVLLLSASDAPALPGERQGGRKML